MKTPIDNLNKVKIWKFIEFFNQQNGHTPTLQEIADYMNFKYRQQVSYYTDKLKADGRIKIIPRKKRSIEIIKYNI